jgi:hypothetical protein
LENLFNPHKYSAFSVFCCVERRKLVWSLARGLCHESWIPDGLRVFTRSVLMTFGSFSAVLWSTTQHSLAGNSQCFVGRAICAFMLVTLYLLYTTLISRLKYYFILKVPPKHR